ncbi:HAMP domain-containing protein [Actinobacteria bacterium YIM 96077]|uniref:histidine kinase n=2 Tax=Phytoactinopolyspora halophila TaxID=1981511 RepID=A0A329QTW5_9ACTN|nr:HAMP domain-containing protein [Actinobacteria bacterium YIM 96077]RAW15481.1 two-component sensor histidine kinase [Phytoactinopolyspora halophila]
MFVLAGALSLATLYVVVQHRLDEQLTGGGEDSRIAQLREEAARSEDSTVTMPDGSEVPLEQVVAQAQAEQEEIKDAALNALATQGSLAVLGVGLVAAATGWAVAGRGLRPLRAITTTAQRIANSSGVERDLSERIALTGRDDEIKRLADTFDAMLDNLDEAFDAQRQFVAHASHELRTPLAMERGLIELEMTRPSATPDSIHFARSLLEINERHTRLVNGMLFLANSQNVLERPVAVDLDDVAHHVAAAHHTMADELGVMLESELHVAPIRGDPVLLEQLTRNLVENALRHNVDNGWALVTTGIEYTQAYLTISNSGPVLHDYEVDNLFEPFQRRRSEDAVNGRHSFGLGLSIVKAIVTTHGGAVSARGRPDGGMDVTVHIPLRAEYASFGGEPTVGR